MRFNDSGHADSRGFRIACDRGLVGLSPISVAVARQFDPGEPLGPPRAVQGGRSRVAAADDDTPIGVR